MRKLVSIVRISGIEDIENSDFLSVAKMEGKGWNVVVKKGEFSVGDKAVYFEIDSSIPGSDSRFEFLSSCKKDIKVNGHVFDSRYIIRTKKLRGVVSQGIVLPIDMFDEIPNDINVGEDVSSILNVITYDDAIQNAYIESEKLFGKSNNTFSPFPSWIQKTDEERLQNLIDYFDTYKDHEFEVTEKNDGSSVTFFYNSERESGKEFGVCSRNRELDVSTGEKQWNLAVDYRDRIVDYCVSNGRNLAFQGEMVGPSIQGNKDAYERTEWHLFKVWDIDKQQYLLPSERIQLAKDLNIPHVEVVHRHFKLFQKFKTIDEVLEFVKGKTIRGHEREGFVFKDCNDPEISFKVINNKYLLKNGI